VDAGQVFTIPPRRINATRQTTPLVICLVGGLPAHFSIFNVLTDARKTSQEKTVRRFFNAMLLDATTNARHIRVLSYHTNITKHITSPSEKSSTPISPLPRDAW
jgi:hypothetical protein